MVQVMISEEWRRIKLYVIYLLHSGVNPHESNFRDCEQIYNVDNVSKRLTKKPGVRLECNRSDVCTEAQ